MKSSYMVCFGRCYYNDNNYYMLLSDDDEYDDGHRFDEIV